MRWWPRISDGYLMTPLQWAAIRLALTASALIVIIGELKMLSFIPDLKIAIVCGIFCAVFVMLCVEYSRWQLSIKKHKDTEKEKASRQFGFVPYLIIPFLGCCISAGLTLALVDTVTAHGYIYGEEEIYLAVGLGSLVAWLILDKLFMRNVGDAAYFDTVEDKIVEKATQKVSIESLSAEDRMKLAAELLTGKK